MKILVMRIIERVKVEEILKKMADGLRRNRLDS